MTRGCHWRAQGWWQKWPWFRGTCFRGVKKGGLRVNTFPELSLKLSKHSPSWSSRALDGFWGDSTTRRNWSKFSKWFDCPWAWSLKPCLTYFFFLSGCQFGDPHTKALFVIWDLWLVISNLHLSLLIFLSQPAGSSLLEVATDDYQVKPEA